LAAGLRNQGGPTSKGSKGREREGGKKSAREGKGRERRGSKKRGRKAMGGEGGKSGKGWKGRDMAPLTLSPGSANELNYAIETG